MLIVAMLFMSVASFSQITISQEDYDRLSSFVTKVNVKSGRIHSEFVGVYTLMQQKS